MFVSRYILPVFCIFFTGSFPDLVPYPRFCYSKAGSGLIYGFDDLCLVYYILDFFKNFRSVLSQASFDVNFGLLMHKCCVSGCENTDTLIFWRVVESGVAHSSASSFSE